MLARYSFLLLFFFTSNFIRAQSFIEFPDSNVSWMLGFQNDFPFTTDYSVAEYRDVNDTSINGFIYRKLFWAGYAGAYRKIGVDTVMFIPPDSSHEFLLYDFSVQPGDSLEVWTNGFTNPGLNKIYCYSISDPFEVSNHFFRQYYFEPNGSWLSGLGGTGGPLTTDYMPSVSGLYFLQCVSIHDSIVFSPMNNCFGVGIENYFMNSSIKLFPNPATTSFQLSYSLNVSSPLTITDALGRVVNEVTLDASSEKIIISINDLPAGVYLLSLTKGDRKASKKLIVTR